MHQNADHDVVDDDVDVDAVDCTATAHGRKNADYGRADRRLPLLENKTEET